MPAAGTPVTNGMPTDERMHAQGKVNGGSTPVVKAPPTPTALPTVSKPGRINPLTGMPFGAMPGETAGMTPDQVANAGAMAAQRAAQGTPAATPRDIAGAQRTMESAGVTPVGSMTRNAPRAVPVVAPAPPTFAQRMRVTPGPKIANPDDPRKFFTGRVLPLDQLVKR